MNLIVFWLSAAGFIALAVMRVTDPMLPVFADEFNISVGAAALVVTAYAVPYGIFQLVWGPLGDRLGKLKVIARSLLVSSVFIASCSLAPNFEVLTILRFLSAIMTAAVVPLALAFIADNVSYAQRQPVLGRYAAGLIFGQIMGASIGGIFTDYFGWRNAFSILGVITAIIAILLWRASNKYPDLSRPTGTASGRWLAPYARLLRQKQTQGIVIICMVEGVFCLGGFAFFGAYLRVQFGLEYTVVGLLLGLSGLGGIAYALSVRRVLQRLGQRWMIVSGSLVSAACSAGFAVAPSWQWTMPLLFINGYAFYVMHNTFQTIATELAPNERATGISIFVFTLCGGMGIGVAALGPIVDASGYATAFGLIALGTASLAILGQRVLIEH